MRRPAPLGCWGERCGGGEGDLVHVLRGGGHQALTLDPNQAAKASVAMAEERLGVGEAALHRLLAPRMDALAPIGAAAGVRALARLMPDMAGQGSFGLAARGA